MLYEINNFKRNYNSSQTRFIEVTDGKSKPPANYTPCDQSRIKESAASHLYTQGPFRYYGYL